MPALTEQQVKDGIADGTILAVSVDTSIFDRYGSNLSYPALTALAQFPTRGVDVILSEVVEGEVVAHIRRDATETQRALKSAINKHRKRWSLSAADATAPAGFAVAADPGQMAQAQFDAFVAAVGAEILPASEPDTVAAEVLRRYFAFEPPFKDSEKKKNEFPDAFALLSLEARAEQDGHTILCVSGDDGWMEFAEGSAHLACIKDIEKLLSLLHEADAAIAENALALFRAGQAPQFTAMVESAIAYRLEDNDFEIDADAPIDYEAEPLWAAIQSIAPETASPATVLSADDESVTFTFELTVTVGFEANFSYYVRDSIDRDYVGLGSEEEYREKEVVIEVAATMARALQNGQPEPIEAQVPRQRFDVNFGYVEPFRNEDPTHEKY